MIKPHNLTGCLFWVSVHVKDELRWRLRSFLVFWFLYTHLHCGMDSFLSHPLSSWLPESHASLLFPCFNFHLWLVSLFHDTDLPFHWAALPPSQQVGKVGRREQGLWYWFRVSLALVEKWGVAFKGYHPASTWYACSFPLKPETTQPGDESISIWFLSLPENCPIHAHLNWKDEKNWFRARIWKYNHIRNWSGEMHVSSQHQGCCQTAKLSFLARWQDPNTLMWSTCSLPGIPVVMTICSLCPLTRWQSRFCKTPAPTCQGTSILNMFKTGEK